MLRSFAPALALATMALVGPAVAQTPPAPTPAQPAQQEKVKATYGAWQIKCVGDNPSNCVMAEVGKGPQGNDIVEVRIRKLNGVKTDAGQEVPAAIQVLTPLGVLLPAGVRLQIDAKNARAAPYEICAQVGCVVRQAINDDFLNELKGGSNAKVIIVAPPKNEVTASLSLDGFTKAYNSLQP